MELKTDSKTDFDFFRFKKERRRQFTDAKKNKMRRKFRKTLSEFIRKYRNGEAEVPRALRVIVMLQKERNEVLKEIRNLKVDA